MADKRVEDVAKDYQPAPEPAGNADLARIKRRLRKIKAGALERKVDKLLSSKGLIMDEPVSKLPRRLGLAGKA